jgi:hypothetical protein
MGDCLPTAITLTPRFGNDVPNTGLDGASILAIEPVVALMTPVRRPDAREAVDLEYAAATVLVIPFALL